MTRDSLLACAVSLASLSLSAMESIGLDGLWDFRLEAGRSLEDVGMPAFEANDKMTVPGCWDAMSHWYNQRGTGCYRRTFELEGDAVNAFLCIDGACLRSRYWIDGREIGFSKLPWSRLRFATGPLKAGRHEIACAVDSIVDSAKVKLFSNFYDFYASGGFQHGMRLEIQRLPVEPARLVVRTRDFRTGLVELELQFEGDGAPRDFSAGVSFDGGAERRVPFSGGRARMTVPGFRLWSPSSPNLHAARVSFGEGDALRRVSARFGIRQVGTDNGRITLNGEPIYIKGVNRHEAHYEFGSTSPLQLMYEDVRNLKDLGGNFIRGSHYPQCEAFLNLCDEMGVMVWEESLGWGNRREQLEDVEFCDLQEEQTRMMVRASINHPCIVISAFLNEPRSDEQACRRLVDRLIGAIREEDTGHLVTYACCHPDVEICHTNTDIIAYNIYPCWYNDELDEGSAEEMRGNIRRCHERTVGRFRRQYGDRRPIIVSESGVKADYGARDPRGKAQYTEDFQAEYTRLMLEEIFANREIGGIAIWQFTDAKTYTRTRGLRNRSYGVNTGGLYDLYRRPKLVVDVVREAFSRKSERD